MKLIPNVELHKGIRALARMRAAVLAADSFAHRAWVLISGIASAQIIGIVATMALTRLYTPADFGAYGVFLAIIGIGAVFATLRYERALVVKRSRSERHGLALLMCGIAACASFLTFVAARASHSFVTPAGALHIILSSFAGVTGIALGLNGLQVAARALALKEAAFTELRRLRISEALVLAGCQMALALLLNRRAMGLMLGTVLSLVYALVYLVRLARQREWLDFGRYRTHWARAWVAARRNSEYPKYMTLSSLLNSTAPQVPVLMIGALIDPALAGQFFLAQRIVKGPMAWVTSGVSDVNFQDASERRREDLLKIYLTRVRKLRLLGLVLFGAMAAVAPVAFGLVFGAEWREAGVITSLFAPGLYAQWVYTPFTPLFVVINQQRMHLWWSIFRLALVGVGVYSGIIAWGIRGAAVGFGAALFISFAVQHALLLRLLKAEAGRPLRGTGVDSQLAGHWST